jgi:hypothetical protein
MSLVFQKIDPPPPSPPGECVLPPLPNKGGGRRGGWRVNMTRGIGLPSYSNNLSTDLAIHFSTDELLT